MEDKEQYIYRCVINGYINATLEVCAPNRIIFVNVLSVCKLKSQLHLMLKVIKTFTILYIF